MKNLIIGTVALISVALLSTPSSAEKVECIASVADVEQQFHYTPSELYYSEYTWREDFLITIRGVDFESWEKADDARDWLIGNQTCPSAVVLKHFTPHLAADDREDYCLVFDSKSETYVGFAKDKRDAFLTCKSNKTFCENFKEAKGVVMSATGLAAGATGAAALGTSGIGVTAVAHSSGAVILTGSSGYIAGTLGTVGATGLSVLTAPVTVTAAAIAAVAVGGAYYVCSDS
ncbi:hypothetical protein [Shimia sp.]|uniref:hypothetical protein n=1 Tax=Shimia sp. TaxID=1954381 RepID=UPI003298FB20